MLLWKFGRLIGFGLVVGGLLWLLGGSSSESIAQTQPVCSASFSLNPTTGSTAPGGSTNFDIRGAASGPCAWAYRLSLAQTRTGITMTFNPQSGVIPPNGSGSSRATTQVATTVPPAIYELTIRIDLIRIFGERQDPMPPVFKIYTLHVLGAPRVPDIDVSPTSIDFGAVPIGTTATRLLTIRNVGQADLFISSAAIQGGTASPFHLGGRVFSGITLRSGQGVTIQVFFTPRTTGLFEDAVVIRSNDPDEATVTVLLSGQTPIQQLKAQITTDRGCLEKGQSPIYFVGDRITVQFRVDGVEQASATIEDILPDGQVRVIFQQVVPGNQTLRLTGKIEPPLGREMLRLTAQAGGQIAQDWCSFTVQALGKIVGFKFEDLNGNGSRDPGEPGVSNWGITLQGTASQQTRTDAQGRFEFTVPVPGDYRVSEAARPVWTPTGPTAFPFSLTVGQVAPLLFFGNQQNTYRPIKGLTQDFSLPCSCRCTAMINGPDTIQMGHNATESYTVTYSIACTDYAPGGWISAFRTSEVHWFITAPASVSGKGLNATVTSPPPRKANESIEVTLTAEWDCSGICISGSQGERYNAVNFKCTARKTILLTSQCQDLKAEIERLKAEITLKQQEKEQLSQKVKELEEKLKQEQKDLEAEIKQREQELEKLKQQLAEAEKERDAAKQEFDKAEADFKKAEAEFEAIRNALESIANLYHKLTLKERFIKFLKQNPGGCGSWASQVKKQFIKEIFGPGMPVGDEGLDVLCQAAYETALNAIIPVIGQALVDLGSLASLIGSGPLDAAASLAIGEFVSQYIQQLTGQPASQFDQLPYDQKKKVLEGLMGQLKAKLEKARVEMEKKAKELQKAEAKLKSAQNNVDKLSQQKEKLEQTLNDLKEKKKTLEETLQKDIADLKERIEKLDREIEELEKSKKELEEEFQRNCK